MQDEQTGVAQHFLPIASVALAGIIQISTQTGPFNLWNVMLGLPLVLLLALYSPHQSLSVTETLAWSVTWGLIGVSTSGVFFQAGYRLWNGMSGLMPPFFNEHGVELSEWEAPHYYYFGVWLILSGMSYLVFRLRAPR